MTFLLRFRILLVLFVVLPLSGCLFRSRKVTSNVSTAKLQSTTKDELIQRINSEASKIQTLNATVDIDTAVGGSGEGKNKEKKQNPGYVLVRKPAMLPTNGILPPLRKHALLF